MARVPRVDARSTSAIGATRDSNRLPASRETRMSPCPYKAATTRTPTTEIAWKSAAPNCETDSHVRPAPCERIRPSVDGSHVPPPRRDHLPGGCSYGGLGEMQCHESRSVTWRDEPGRASPPHPRCTRGHAAKSAARSFRDAGAGGGHVGNGRSRAALRVVMARLRSAL